MIEQLVPLQYLKKEPFYGSYKGMQFRIAKEEEKLVVVIYPRPYCYDATPKGNMQEKEFPFTDEGRGLAHSWLMERYEAEVSKWEADPRW